ncbi:unnamed protein product [Orchesella dallaii]|uniref:Calponin-homology (CH) domain-containing protein n=1 Tax=Orchesella dallaii TaxID=48710 RepID=A0ABP1SA16_9HEXA
MDPATRKSHGQDQALASDTFDKFCNANTLKDILALYRQLCSVCKLVPTNFHEFFPKIRGKIPSWRAEELWSRFEKKASEKCYARGRYCGNTKVLIIGAGPCGLRAAIDAQLLGAKVVVIEKREKLSRNNVLHLWPFVIADLRGLGAKVLYGKFCAGSIDHISIRQIQCILLKVALLLGVEFYEGVGFQGLVEPSSSALDDGWRAQITPSTHPLSQYQFDVILGADGRQSILSSEGFKRKALRAKLAIAITANFINKHTEAEAKVEEISGVSYIFRQQFFQDFQEAMGIALENIVYYKDETHYFVMTPKKQSLLEKRVLYQDFPEPELLLAPENVDQEALQRFTMEAVVFATDNRLPELEFALNHYGQPDVAVFDFTTMYASENACRAVQRKGHKLLIGLVGDALLEPFWPTGSGCARGFLSSYDAAWMIRGWGKGLNSVLEVLAERESIYRLLGQTTPENLSKDHNQFNIDPRSRYPKINLGAVNARQITYLYDSDVPIKDVYDPIRDPNDSKLLKEFVMPAEFLVRWLQEQLSSKNVQIGSLTDVLNEGKALPALLHRYRPDLIQFPLPDNVDKCIKNQLIFEILQDEFDIGIPMDCEKSVGCGDSERGILTRYLSQIYLRFRGDICRDTVFIPEASNKRGAVQYPNNSKLHHSLSIKEFLRAKAELERSRKEEEDNQSSKREKRRSQFYDALMASESQNTLQKSQTSINVVIPVVKLNPVPPGELFAACRQGRDKDVACENRPTSVASPIPPSTKALIRSRSDVGFRRGPSPLATTNTPPPSALQSSRSVVLGSAVKQQQNLQLLQQQQQQESEAVEMQMRIMKRRTTPAGAILSTFLQKQAIAKSMEQEEQENWTKRQIRDMRARSLNQNSFNGWGKKPENEQNNYFNQEQQEQQLQHQQQQPLGPDVSFKDRCKFLEKNIYNSGRDIKVHTSSVPWFSETTSARNSKPNSPGPAPLQKSPSSLVSTTTTFLAKPQPSSPPVNTHQNSPIFGGNFFQQTQQHQQKLTSNQKTQKSSSNSNVVPNKMGQKPQPAEIEQKLNATIAGMKAQLVNPPQYHINGQIIHPGNGSKTSKSSGMKQEGLQVTRTHIPTLPQQAQPLRRSATSIGVALPSQNHHHHHQTFIHNKIHNGGLASPFINAKVVTDSSGESDSDNEFLKAIDFESLDGQELQELLSSF